MSDYTKKQLQRIIKAWGVDAPIPSKNKPIIVHFPDNCDLYDFRQAIITKTTRKSGDGLVLYSIEFKN